METNRGKLQSLQDLRAFSVLLVLLFHAAGLYTLVHNQTLLFGIFRNGYIGVDIFFVISGFIIYYIHHKDIGRKERISAYAYKRLIRIIPICWIVMIGTIILNYLTQNLQSLETMLNSFLFYPQEETDALLVVTWTLTHEIIFYLLFALLIWSRKSIMLILFWIVLMVIFIFESFNVESLLIKAILSPYNFEFLFGVLVAYLITNGIRKRGLISLFVGICSLLISYSYFVHNEPTITRVALIGIPSALIIYGLVTLEQQGKIKSSRLLSFIGDASYSIYLTHYPLLSLINKIGEYVPLHHGVYIYINIVLTLLIGCIFHLIVEKPLLNRLKSRNFSWSSDWILYRYHQLMKLLYRKKGKWQSSSFEHHRKKMEQYKETV